jgi:hypothetical protein
MNSARPKAKQKPIIQRRYLMQGEACSQAVKLLLKRAAGVLSANGGDAMKGSLTHEDRAETSLPR